jgi:hypothetical protein
MQCAHTAFTLFSCEFALPMPGEALQHIPDAKRSVVTGRNEEFEEWVPEDIVDHVAARCPSSVAVENCGWARVAERPDAKQYLSRQAARSVVVVVSSESSDGRRIRALLGAGRGLICLGWLSRGCEVGPARRNREV